MSTFETISRSVLQSSKNPSQLSLTVRGILVTLIPIFTTLGAAYGTDVITVEYVTMVIDFIVEIINTVTLLVGLLMTLWGLIRKVW